MAKVKSRKRSASTSSCVSDSGSHKSSDEEEYRKRLKKLKKKIKKEERKAAKLLKKELRSEKKTIKKQKAKRRSLSEFPSQVLNLTEANQDNPSTNVPLGLMERSKAMAPMTKEEWEKRQSIIRRVKDEETGRYRLIKGDGEVLEEIVSKERHKEINRLATKADGDFFQSQTVDK